MDTCYTSISFNAFSRRSISSAMLSSVLSTSFRSTLARTDSSLACGSCTTCVLISSLLVANLLGNRLRSRLGTSLHFTSGLVLNIQNKIDEISQQNVEMSYQLNGPIPQLQANKYMDSPLTHAQYPVLHSFYFCLHINSIVFTLV